MSDTANLINDDAFITDMARYAVGILTEAQVKKKYRFDDDTWTRLGEDDKLVEAIELKKTQRLFRNDTARERAQLLFADAPTVLGNIMTSGSASPRHKIESARALGQIATPAPTSAPAADASRFIIQINLGNDEILTYNKPLTPQPHADIDHASQEMLPAISSNKQEDKDNTNSVPQELLAIVANKQTDGGDGGQSI
jgi:hypothetical protein